MAYRKVSIRGIEYLVADLPTDKYGMRKRIYGSTPEELEGKLAYAQKLLEIEQSVERPEESAPFSEYVAFMIRHSNVSCSFRRKRLLLLNAFIVNSLIDAPLATLNEKKLSGFLTSLRASYSELTVDAVRSIIVDTFSLSFVAEMWPLNTRKIIAEEPFWGAKSCFLSKSQLNAMRSFCLSPASEKFGVGKELLVLLLGSGIKVKDLISAKRGAVNAEAGTFTTKDGFLVPLQNIDVSWLKNFLKKRDLLYGEGGLLFLREDKTSLTRTAAGMTISRIARICEMPSGCTANAIHRSIVCHLFEDGANPFELAEWYGYRNVDAVLELQKEKRVYYAIRRG